LRGIEEVFAIPVTTMCDLKKRARDGDDLFPSLGRKKILSDSNVARLIEENSCLTNKVKLTTAECEKKSLMLLESKEN
jgi:hypothetical protein